MSEHKFEVGDAVTVDNAPALAVIVSVGEDRTGIPIAYLDYVSEQAAGIAAMHLLKPAAFPIPADKDPWKTSEPPASRNAMDNACRKQISGALCTRLSGHDGHHIGRDWRGNVFGRWKNEADPYTEAWKRCRGSAQMADAEKLAVYRCQACGRHGEGRVKRENYICICLPPPPARDATSMQCLNCGVTATKFAELMAERDKLRAEVELLKGAAKYQDHLKRDWQGIAERHQRERNEAVQELAVVKRELERVRRAKR